MVVVILISLRSAILMMPILVLSAPSATFIYTLHIMAARVHARCCFFGARCLLCYTLLLLLPADLFRNFRVVMAGDWLYTRLVVPL